MIIIAFHNSDSLELNLIFNLISFYYFFKKYNNNETLN